MRARGHSWNPGRVTNRQWLITDTVLLGLAVATLGCATDPDGSDGNDGETGDEGESSFQLESASLDASGQVVVLRFSAPVGPVDEVDPSAFRISYAIVAQLCDEQECIAETSYWDPNFFVTDYIGYPNNGYSRFEVDQISAGAQATEITLHFELPLDPVLCEHVAPVENYYDVLFVHYAPGDIPLTSSDGESLAAIGPQWVEHESPQPSMELDGKFPNLDPKIPIPCSL